MAAIKELVGATVKNHKNEDAAVDTFTGEGKYVGLYFSAHWCPPCRSFTPKLAEFYKKLKANGYHHFEIIFVSCDRDDKSFKEYYETMPWLTIAFDDEETRNKVMEKFDVNGIPALIILDGATGKTVNENGREQVDNDPEGTTFPWKSA